MKALILSGGSGTRLRPLTYTDAKQLIPVANKPILFYAIEDVVRAGIKDIGIIVGHTKDDVMKAVGDGSKWGANITYIEQDAPKGLAHAVKISEEFMNGDSFVMYLGDNLLRDSINDVVDKFNNSDSDASIMLCHVPNPQQFGVAQIKEDGTVVKLEEKPKKPKSDLALVGIYLFNNKIFDAVKAIKPSWRDELEITDAIQWLVEKGMKVDTHVVTGWWKDTGKPEDILDANRLILEKLEPENNGTTEEGVKIIGRVKIGKGTVIKKGSHIQGPAIIGEGCEIGPDAFIGPFTAIGDKTFVNGAEIENSVVLGESTIACSRRIRDSLIGRNCKIEPIENRVPKTHRLVLGENSEISV